MVEYNPQIIQKSANRLYLQANIMVIVSTILGVIFGFVLGFLFSRGLGALPQAQQYEFIGSTPTNLVTGFVVLVLLGARSFWGGTRRAFLLRLQAQAALCQMKTEENTHKTAV